MTYALGQGTGPLKGSQGRRDRRHRARAARLHDPRRPRRRRDPRGATGRPDAHRWPARPAQPGPARAWRSTSRTPRRSPPSWTSSPRRTCWSRACGRAPPSGSGSGPTTCLARNPRLVYGRMTGWGQDGPLAQRGRARHELHRDHRRPVRDGSGAGQQPNFPANLVGDFGGGSTYLVIGILAALLEARLSGEGQVVDAAIVDGTAHLNAMSAGMLSRAALRRSAAANLLDGGMPFYDLYETADGRHMSVGAAGAAVLRRSSSSCSASRTHPTATTSSGPRSCGRPSPTTFASRTHAEWTEVFEGTDACVAPVLPLTEATEHPHIAARETFVERDGVRQPAPAPRFSRTPASLSLPAAPEGRRRHPGSPGAWGVERRRRPHRPKGVPSRPDTAARRPYSRQGGSPTGSPGTPSSPPGGGARPRAESR